VASETGNPPVEPGLVSFGARFVNFAQFQLGVLAVRLLAGGGPGFGGPFRIVGDHDCLCPPMGQSKETNRGSFFPQSPGGEFF